MSDEIEQSPEDRARIEAALDGMKQLTDYETYRQLTDEERAQVNTYMGESLKVVTQKLDPDECKIALAVAAMFEVYNVLQRRPDLHEMAATAFGWAKPAAARSFEWICDPKLREPDELFLGMWEHSPLVAVCGMTQRPASDDGTRPFNITVYVDEGFPPLKDDRKFAIAAIRREVNKVVLNVTGYPLDDDKIEVKLVSRK